MDIEQPKEMDDIQKLASVKQGACQDIQLDPEMEKSVLRRFDKFLLPQIALIIIIGYLDRSNIGRHSSHPQHSHGMFLSSGQEMLPSLAFQRTSTSREKNSITSSHCFTSLTLSSISHGW